MAIILAALKGTDGKFYRRSVEEKRGRRVAPKVGDPISAGVTVAKVTTYSIRSKVKKEIDGKVKAISDQVGPAFDKLEDAVAYFHNVEANERSRKAEGDFGRDVTPAPIAVVATSVDLPADGVPQTWAQLTAEYFDQCRLKVKTGAMTQSSVKAYSKSIRYLTEYLSKRSISRLADITPKMLDQFKEARIDGGAAQSHHYDTKRLSPVFKLAVELGSLAKSPLRKMKIVSATTSADRGSQPFEDAEYKALLAEAKKSDFDNLVFHLLAQTGMRRSDAISLQWKDVNGHITFRPVKTKKFGKDVRMPIAKELQAILDDRRAELKPKLTDHVVLHPATGRPFSSSDHFYEYVTRLGERADVHSNPHRFRDTFAVNCLTNGMSIETVAFYLGDTVKTTAQHYAAWNTKRMDQADTEFRAAFNRPVDLVRGIKQARGKQKARLTA